MMPQSSEVRTKGALSTASADNEGLPIRVGRSDLQALQSTPDDRLQLVHTKHVK